jgi:osomolarity two-component system sensor histidine kinase CHK1
MNTMSDTILLPTLRQNASSASIHSESSSSDSRRKNSGAVTSAAPQNSDFSSELDLQSVMRASLAIQEGPHVRNIILKLVHIIMQTAGANYGCVMLSQQTIERKQLYIEVIGNENKIDLVNHRPLKSQTEVVPARLCEYGAFLLFS